MARGEDCARKKRRRGDGDDPADPVAHIPPAVQLLFFDKEASGRRESLLDYTTSQEPVVQVPVPGDEHSRCSKLSERAMLAECACCCWFDTLHDLGYSLDVDVQPQDFGIDHLGILKGDYSLLLKVKTHFGNRRKNNMVSLANNVIESGVLVNRDKRIPIPEDLEHLLKLLRNYKRRYSPLVRDHTCHDVEAVKSALVIKMRNRLKVLEVTNNVCYNDVLKKITNGNTWRTIALRNRHLHNLLKFNRRQNPPSLAMLVADYLTADIAQTYTETATGLMSCRRNGQAHLEPDYSVDEDGLKDAALTAACAASVEYASMNGKPAGEKLPPRLAGVIGQAIFDALHAQLPCSLVEAKEAATAAALAVVRHQYPFSKNASNQAAADATAAASAVAAPHPQPLAGVAYSQMFSADDVGCMFEFSAPNLLVDLQKAMFEEGEDYCLDKRPKIVLLHRNAP